MPELHIVYAVSISYRRPWRRLRLYGAHGGSATEIWYFSSGYT